MLKLIVGQMKSGKSSRLIDYVDEFREQGVKFKVFYPASCNKVDGYVYSRDNDRSTKAIKVYNVDDLYNNIDDAQVLLLDEYTFYVSDSQVNEFINFIEHCDKNGINVYLFGLQLDYMSRGFDLAHRILPYADEVIVANARCEFCGGVASRQIRFIDGKLDTDEEADTLQMESSDIVYKACCRKCYRELTGKPAIR